MDALRTPASPFPLDPGDVPGFASTAVRRALLRHPDPDPDLIVAVVLAAVCGSGAQARPLVVTATAPGRGFPVMTIATTRARLAGDLDVVLGCCEGMDGLTVTIKALA